MTDEELSISDVTLIARLRNTPNWMREGFQNWKDNVRTYDTAPFEAAARIEQLVATNEALLAEREKDHANINLKADFIDKTINQLAEADAKLTKAVEVLEHAKLNMPHPDQMIDDTLAELKGENHDRPATEK